MIIYKTGNVVDALKNDEIDVLVHGVNCQGKMNSGIAKEIRAEFPEVFKDYEFYVSVNTPFSYESQDTSTELLGQTQTVRLGTSFKFVVNAFTQNEYGYDIGTKYCSYDAIDTAMKSVAKECEGMVKIGMPKIGSKRGGGNWNVIEAIINSHFLDRDIYVYTLEELPKKSGKNDVG